MKKIITEKQIKNFKLHLNNEEKSAATVKKYIRDVQHFLGYAGQKEVTKALTMSYKLELEKGYAATSANSMLAALNAFLKHVGWQECCVKPLKLQKKAYCSAEKELTKEEYFQLILTAKEINDERMYLLLQTLGGTGIRIGELEYITREAVERGEAIVTCKGKTRHIFIVRVLKESLLDYAKKKNIENGPIFVTRSGKPLDRSNIWNRMKKICKLAKIPEEKVFPHNLRHLFARTFYEIEKDIAKLADILGHESIETTRIYIVTTGEEHKRKLEKMHMVI